MCGRFIITSTPDVFRDTFGYAQTPNFPARYNVAPTQPVPVVVHEAGAPRFRLVRWGFLPSWTKDPKDFPLVINARAETLLEKPTFKAAMKRRRCVFLADGFYEWRREGRVKAPWLIRMASGGPMPMAGLWETYADPSGGEIDTAAIVTTDANGTLSAIHHRMPVILSLEDVPRWLDGAGTSDVEARALARPCPDAWIDMVPVSPRVNKVANDDAQNIVPLDAEAPAPEEPRAGRGRTTRNTDEDGQGRLL
ncbi:SOS response-associated peptidase [Salinarimonas rosea]|uniref:SOS response-associated peptidase n=1 Tax=Salinarimonas rosea TaxID=552063 RepID=UPI0003F67955|nr:SOS response-associated peptidase [Salinarimonas rosea]